MKAVYTKLFDASAPGFGLSYFLTRADVTVDGVPHPRFGAAVEKSTGERAEVLDIFPTSEEASRFLARLRQGLVTPVTLTDVVYDELCRSQTA